MKFKPHLEVSFAHKLYNTQICICIHCRALFNLFFSLPKGTFVQRGKGCTFYIAQLCNTNEYLKGTLHFTHEAQFTPHEEYKTTLLQHYCNTKHIVELTSVEDVQYCKSRRGSQLLLVTPSEGYQEMVISLDVGGVS